jgi:large subunit ribosomal protein L10
LDRKQKEDLVASLHSSFEAMNLIVVTHFSGLTVVEINDLRARMRNAGATFKVTQNRLIKLALKNSKFENISDVFSGPTAIAFSDDPVSAAKIAVEYSKENEKLIILGGALGQETLNRDAIMSLASLPSLDELRSKIICVLNTPATNLVGMLNAPANQLNGVIAAYSKLQ